MKYLTIFILSIVFSLTAICQTNPRFDFTKNTIKHNKVKAGEKIQLSYPFKNTGEIPLLITDIKVSCSCTKVTWTKAPILPNASDTIKVNVDTKSMVGWQDRILEVYSNSPSSPDKLRFKVMVDHKK